MSTLRGQVTDETGAVVPAANVSLIAPHGAVKNATADNQGAYVFTEVTPGNYRVQGSAPQLAASQTFTVRPGAQTLNLQLRVVSANQRVTVQDDAGPTVSTDVANNASALVLTGDDLLALSDDPDDLLADLQALAGPSAGPSGGSIFIDGFSGGELPAKNSIREVRINQNPFSPEYDKLGYGRIEIFTKPGTDRYHAQVDYNLGTDWWNSRNPYSAQKAPLLLNEFEGNGGGPLNHRASFTLDAQRNMVDNGAIINAVTLDPKTFVPTPFFSVFTNRQRFTRVSPRIDYQLSEKNTVMFRYTVTKSDIPGAGIGSFDLVSRGYDYQYTNQTVQLTDTAVFGTTINETRFQYFRSASRRIADTDAPEIQVLGSFNAGGSQLGRSFDTQNNFELQNYTSLPRGAHVWKFGFRLRGQTDDNVSPLNFNGTYTYGGGLAPALDANNQPVLDSLGMPIFADISSIERYRRTLLSLPGGGATQFSINTGNPALAVHQADVGTFAGDDWRVRPNVTLSLGLRYEAQTNIHDRRDFAPRLAIAWAPGGSVKNPKPKTVLRAGFGAFYDRFALANTLTAQRYNGIIQQQFVTTGSNVVAGQVIQEVSSSLRAPYILQSAVTLERQLPANTTLAVTFTNSHGLHEFRSEDINAPLPGSGLFPLGQSGPIFLMESSGLYNQNQMIANFNSKVNAGLSLNGSYTLNRARSNTDGLGTFPANPYNFAGEYGPAATDIRQRVSFGGTINTKWNVRFSPLVTLQSGPPFDITTGSDLYGTTLFNGRPGIATDPSKPGLIQTKYGLLDPNPTAGETILTRNYGRGPGLMSVNLRIGKTFAFGKERAGASVTRNRGIFSPPPGRRYNLILSMSIRNLLNHTNPGPIDGNITSPLFGRANQSAGNLNGEGFSENANNRRLESQVRFTF